jgi:hypothetical protein
VVSGEWSVVSGLAFIQTFRISAVNSPLTTDNSPFHRYQ